MNKAAEMREIANLVRDPALKTQYIELAAQYEDLASLARQALQQRAGGDGPVSQ